MTINVQDISETFQTLLVDFLRFLPDLITALLVFVISLYMAGFLRRMAANAIERRGAGTQAVLLVNRTVYWAVLLIGTMTALQQVHFDVTAFLAGLGIVGFTIGFALQDVSKNFVAGLLLLVEHPFELGDLIEVSGFTGTVVTINLRATEMRTQDGRVVFIPNADIFTRPIINFSRATARRVEVNLAISFQSDLNLARASAIQALQAVPGVVESPAPEARLTSFGDGSIKVSVFYWVDPKKTDVNAAKDASIAALKATFDRAEVEMKAP